MKLTISLTASIVVVLLPAQVMAAPPTDDQAAALIQRLNELEKEVVALRQQLGTAEAVQQATEIVPTASAKWKGAPEFNSEGGWSFKPRGRILYDVANLSSVPSSMMVAGEGFSNEARRMRLGVQGAVPGGFGYRVEADISSDIELTDAFFDYTTKGLTITVGQHSNFQSLERMTSSNDGSFLERAAFNDAFGFERKVGISAAYSKDALLLQGGVFTDNIDALSDGNNTVGIDGRVIFAPKLGDKQIHIGGSVHWRNLGDDISSLRYRQRPMAHSVDTRFIDTKAITNAKEELTYGLEAALIAGRFHIAGETHWATVKRAGYADPGFFGGAIEAGLFLTDDKREYKNGVFKGVKVKRPLSDGGSGAVQVNVRYDRLDLNSGDIIGGTQDGYMASLVWTPIDYMRFMLNYGHLVYESALGIVPGAPSDYSVDVVAARAQFAF